MISPEGMLSTSLLPEDPAHRLVILQELIGGPIEAVYLEPPNVLLLDEMGKMNADHQINWVATTLARSAQAIRRDDYIAGAAVLVTVDALG